MTYLFIVAGVIVVTVVVLRLLNGGGFGDSNEQRTYQYAKRHFFLSRAEHECYDALVTAVGNEYIVFSQVHLPTLVDNKVKGQNWYGAFRHINGKSVDFVLCNKGYISPKLAIELDDKTHERPERQERDQEVERILREAGMPLLRLENHGHFNPSELSRKIKETLSL